MIDRSKHGTLPWRRGLQRARVLPQIFIAGGHISGYEDLQLLGDPGKVDGLLERASQ